MAQKTYGDIVNFVSAIYAQEGGQDNLVLYLSLANQALAEISEKLDYCFKTWSQALLTLTLTGNTCPLPIDLISPIYVYWDKDPLTLKTRGELDAEDTEWETATGDPSSYMCDGSNIILDTIPTGALLSIYGTAYLTEFTGDQDLSESLVYLPDGYQLMPAFYILKELPFDPEHASEVLRQAKYAQLWKEKFDGVASVTARRRNRGFRYD